MLFKKTYTYLLFMLSTIRNMLYNFSFAKKCPDPELWNLNHSHCQQAPCKLIVYSMPCLKWWQGSCKAPSWLIISHFYSIPYFLSCSVPLLCSCMSSVIVLLSSSFFWMPPHAYSWNDAPLCIQNAAYTWISLVSKLVS